MAKKITKTKTKTESKPRKVCPDCFTARPDFSARMKYPPPCPGCGSKAPPVQPPKKPSASPSTPPGQPIDEPPASLTADIVPISHVVDLKTDFTPQELDFLSLLLGENETVDNAMIKAGYGHLEKSLRYHTANRILEKHVQQAGDIKKLMRACGLGDVQVILKIKSLMENPSATIRMRATELAAKILEMTKESIELNTGIQIVIKKDGQVVETAGQVQATKPQLSLPAPGPKVRMIK